jgi:hypothetical protein
VGQYAITATLSNGTGSLGNYSVTLNSGTLTVNPGSAATTITSHTPNPSIKGQAVTVSFTVLPVSPATATPTGSVTVSDSAGDLPCTVTVAAGQCAITINSSGSVTLYATYSGNADYNSRQSSGVTQTVTAATAPVAGVSPAVLTSFGNVDEGTTSGSKPVTLTNTGNAALAITHIAASTNFQQTNNCPSSLGAGKSCTINVSFAPTASGPLTGTLCVTDNSEGVSGSKQTVSLSGTGVGRPSVSIVSTTPTPEGGNILNLNVEVTNNGTGNGVNLKLNQVVLRTLGGIGTATLIAPALPLSVGSLNEGANTTITLTLNCPSTVTKLSVTLNGTVQDGAGNTLSYSIAGVVFP